MNETSTHFFNELGLAFRKQRIDLKIKQTELAARSGVSRDTIISIEKGRDTVSIGAWYAVAQALGLADAWDHLKSLPVDPFEEYDRRQEERKSVVTARVRGKKP